MNSDSTIRDRADSSDRRESPGRKWRIARKELVEILRDRRTIITLLLMPLLVYPLLGMVVQKLMVQNVPVDSEIIYLVGMETESAAREFMGIYDQGEALAAQQDRSLKTADEGDANARKQVVRQPEIKFDFDDAETIRGSIRGGKKYDLGVIRGVDPTSGIPRFELLHNPKSNFSYDAMHYVARRLRLVNDQRLLRLAKLDPAVFVYVEVPVEAKAATQTALLTFIPLMLVLMTITGAVYPAIDLTAGERERGTMEILVAAPISRLVLLFGKFVAVLTVAMLTALANLVAMTITIYALQLDQLIFGPTGIPWSTLSIIFLLLLVLAAFFSATLLCLTSFARSFKEAQAYLIPLMLVAFAPGLLSLTPNLQTTKFLAVVPLVNIVMVGRDLMTGESSLLLIAIAMISTTLYGLLALSLAARIFGADSFRVGERSSWSNLLGQAKRTNQVPSISTAILFLAVLFPGFVVASGLASNIAGRWEATVRERLWTNALVTGLLFVAMPLGFSMVQRLRLRTTYFFHPPRLRGIFAALLLGISVWTLAYEFNILTLSGSRINELLKSSAALKIEFNEVPLSIKLICLAIVPAACEEFTFRGFLLSAFRNRLSASNSILITAVLFGLFHVFVRELLLIERLVPATLMGLLLGFVCIRTGSIFPGMLLHVIHNGFLITLAHHEQYLTELGIGSAGQTHLPVPWLLIAIAPMTIGTILLLLTNRRRS